VNPNCAEINAAAQVDDPSSVFSHYRELVALRKQSELVRQGTYRLLLPDDEKVFAYERELAGERLLVVCNFTADEVTYEVPADFVGAQRLAVACNYDDTAAGVLRPFEALVLSA
jgi:glycosidase